MRKKKVGRNLILSVRSKEIDQIMKSLYMTGGWREGVGDVGRKGKSFQW